MNSLSEYILITGNWPKAIHQTISSMDHLLLWYYLGGVGLGLMILIILSYYPGRLQDFQNKFYPSDKVIVSNQMTQEFYPSSSDSSSNTDTYYNGNGLTRRRHGQRRRKRTSDAEKLSASHLQQQQQQQQPKDKGNNNVTEWAGDHISLDVLERLRQRLHLTKEQMEVVMETSRRQAINNNDDNNNTIGYSDEGLTAHQILNRIVYIIMIVLLIYIANRDYGTMVTIWFHTWLPREAATLGITLSTPSSSSSSSSSS